MDEPCLLGCMDHVNPESNLQNKSKRDKDAEAKASKEVKGVEARLHFGPGTACHQSFALSGTKKSSLPAFITNFEMLETRGR